MKKKFVPLKNKLSWRTVFTAGFYVSLIVALKRIKGRKLELKNPLRFSSCVVCYSKKHHIENEMWINQIIFQSFFPLNCAHVLQLYKSKLFVA